MKTQCPNCRKILSVPDEYEGQRIKCQACKQPLTATPFEQITIVPVYRKPEAPPAILSPEQSPPPHSLSRPKSPAEAPVPKHNFLTRLWAGSPKSFKTTFFGTLGVISAILFSLYAYSHLFSRPRLSPVYQMKTELAAHKLYPVELIGKPGILRGRYLREYTFFPDATRADHYLSLWSDDKGAIVGISAYWFGNKIGGPADIENDRTAGACARNICSAFEDLTGYTVTDLSDNKFTNTKLDVSGSTDIYSSRHGKRFIVISRTKLPLKGSKQHQQTCNSLQIDTGVYDFSATAQNW